jgi:hypothetical protein
VSNPVAAHIDSVSITATDVAAVGGDRINGLDSASFSESVELVDTNYLGGSAYKSRVVTMSDTSAEISGHYHQADAPQALVRTKHLAKVTAYFTFIFDPNAAGGSQGKRVPMLVESFDEKMSPGGLVEWSAKLVGNGTPTAV